MGVVLYAKQEHFDCTANSRKTEEKKWSPFNLTLSMAGCSWLPSQPTPSKSGWQLKLGVSARPLGFPTRRCTVKNSRSSTVISGRIRTHWRTSPPSSPSSSLADSSPPSGLQLLGLLGWLAG